MYRAARKGARIKIINIRFIVLNNNIFTLIFQTNKFEGRKEIWDALRAAVQAMENKDQALAQAIINGANITLPNGSYLLLIVPT